MKTLSKPENICKIAATTIKLAIFEKYFPLKPYPYPPKEETEARDGLIELKKKYAALQLEYDLLRYRYLDVKASYYDAKSDLAEAKEDKTHLVYTSWLGKHDRCVMEFSTSSLLMDETMDKMFCTINLNMRRVKAGGLSGDDAELDFEIITRAIEEAGFDIEKYR